MLPQITPDQKILLQLQVKQDTVGQIHNGVPSGNTNEIQTSVQVGNGDASVLGSILQEDKSHAERKIPVLSELPVLGRSFKRKIAHKDQRELLIFTTPTLAQ